MDKSKIEEMGINLLENIIAKCPTLQSKIPKGDKEMSYDGSIIVFRNVVENRSKDTFEYDIPTQVKSHLDNQKRRIKKQKDHFSVNVEDLKVYLKKTGVVYFEIYFTEDLKEYAIFYNLLYPAKIKSILDRVNSKQKTVSLPFNRLDTKDNKNLEIILRQFGFEAEQQGFGEGPIVKHTIKLNQLEKVKNVRIKALGVTSGIELIKNIESGDFSLYGSFDNESIYFPIEWSEELVASIINHFDQGMGVNGVQYYNSYDIKTLSNGDVFLSPSPNVKVNISSGKINFKPSTHFSEIGNDAKFLLAAINHNGFEIAGNKVEFKFQNTKEMMEGCEFFIELDKLLKEINLSDSLVYSELDDTDRNNLEKFYLFSQKKVSEVKEDIGLYLLRIHDYVVPIVCMKVRDTLVFHHLFDAPIQALAQIEGNKVIQIPLFAIIEGESLAKLRDSDLEIVKTQMLTFLEQDGLEFALYILLHAYSISNKSFFIELVEETLNGIDSESFNTETTLLKYLYQELRFGLSTEDYAELNEMLGEDTLFDLFIYILQKDSENASLLMSKLSNEEKTAIENTVYWTLYNSLFFKNEE